MTDRLRQLMAEIGHPSLPAGLFEAVMGRVAWEKKALSLKRRIAFFGVATLTLTALLAWTFADVRTAMSGSGNLQFLALAFSDTRMVLANWNTFAYSVLESLPIGLLVDFLTVALCFMLALRALIRNARMAYGGHQAFNF